MNRRAAIATGVGATLMTAVIVGIVTITSKTDQVVCSAQECSRTAFGIKQNMNPEVNPCDNFYEFACGKFANSTPVPDKVTLISTFSMVENKIASGLKKSIEQSSRPDEPKPFTMARTLYWTCMNASAIEEAGLEALREILKQLGNWPVVEGDNWKEDDFHWANSTYESRKLGYSINYFISLDISPDQKNSSNNLLHLGPFPVDEDEADGTKWQQNDSEEYQDYVVRIAELFGADKERAIREVRKMLEFYKKLVVMSLSATNRLEQTLSSNQITIAELNKQYSIVNWKEYINELLPRSIIPVDENEIVDVSDGVYMSELKKLLANTPKRVQANYFMWRIIEYSAKYLTDNMKQNMKSDTRWKQCVDIVSKSPLSIAASAMYVRKNFKEETRQYVVEMVARVREALVEILKQADWMDEETRSKAIEKVESVGSLVAFPVELLDDKEIENYYASFDLRSNDLLSNILDLNRWELDLNFEYLRKPVNKTYWITHEFSTTADAFYVLEENNIIIPAGILQGAFFNKDRPRYVNYGAMGFLIGHELSHSLDNIGKRFDKNGNLVNWWSSETEKNYLQRAECITDQYNNYTIESLKVNGQNTLGENIADNGGVKAAYHAYKEYVRKNGPELVLPDLEEYTPKQMFWISAANVWCSRYGAGYLRNQLTTDEHSPARFRVIGPFSNMPEFAADFNCPLGSYMNPERKCDVL